MQRWCCLRWMRMRFLVFSIFLCSISVNSFADGYKVEDCIRSKFKTEVVHKGWPFGLYDIILKIEKDQCHLNIYHEKLKYIKKNWKVDVCRGPVHIKMGTTSVEVFKRRESCQKGSGSSAYCSKYSTLVQVLQDDGLIFAEGQKEIIESDHGRVNCTFELVKRYLNDGYVFSLHANNSEPSIASDSMPFNEASNTEEVPDTGSPADF